MKILSLFENLNLALRDFSKEASVDQVKLQLHKFKNIQQRIGDPEKKDINYWRKQGFGPFTAFISSIENTDSKRKRIARVKASSDDILTVKKTENSHLFFPLSKEASCFYGSGTSWCISTRDGANNFHTYTRRVYVVFLIHESDVYAMVISFGGEIKECNDKRNKNDFPHDEFFRLAGVTKKELMDFASKHHDEIYARINKFEVKEKIQDVRNYMAMIVKHFHGKSDAEINDKDAIFEYEAFEDLCFTITRDVLVALKKSDPVLVRAAETIISKNLSASTFYFRRIKSPFILGEPIIFANGSSSIYLQTIKDNCTENEYIAAFERMLDYDPNLIVYQNSEDVIGVFRKLDPKYQKIINAKWHR